MQWAHINHNLIDVKTEGGGGGTIKVFSVVRHLPPANMLLMAAAVTFPSHMEYSPS
jgi:hypothetical protein